MDFVVLFSVSYGLGLLFYCLLLRYFLVRHLRFGVGVRGGKVISLSSWCMGMSCTCDIIYL